MASVKNATAPLYFLPPSGHRARGLALVILCLAPFLIGLLALYLGQDANWDLRNYHWYNAYAFLNGRYEFDLLPSQTPYFYNPTLDVPFYLLATHVPARVAGFVLGAVQGLNFVLLFMLAYVSLIIPNPRHKVIVCALLAALGILGGGGIAQIGTTFYDNITSLGLLTSALLVIKNFDKLFPRKSNDVAPPPLRGRSGGGFPQPEPTPPLTPPSRGGEHYCSYEQYRTFILALTCGVPSGLMMGLKLPCVIFCIGLCFGLLFIGGSVQRRFLISFAFGLGVLVGVAISLGHWAWYLQSHYGNPLFPYFNQIFKSPLAPLSSARDMAFVTRSFKDFIFFPYIFADSPYRVGEIPWRDWRIPVLYTLLPVAVLAHLFFGRSKNNQATTAVPHGARYLLWVAVLSYFTWLVMFCIYRYAIPLEMLAPLLIVFTVGLLPIKNQTRAMLTAFILITIAFTIQPGNWYRRATWNEKFISADVPELGPASDIMLLMAGFEPYSHLVTQFPPEMPVVRIQSNFSSPDQDKSINAVIHDRIDRHKGRFLMLIPPWQKGVAAEALGYFHLAFTHQPCHKVIDRLYDDKEMALCAVRRVP